MGVRLVDVVVPELGLGGRPVRLSLWLVELGHEVSAGDRLVELVADGVTIDLPAPASGRLAETLVDEDEAVEPSMVIARLTTAASA